MCSGGIVVEASRFHWWGSKMKRASSLEEEVISIKELSTTAF